LKKIIVLTLIFTLLFSTQAFAIPLTEEIGGNIKRIIDNTADNIKAITEILGELIKYTVQKFSDVNANDWFINTVAKLVGMNGIGGYPDGTFRPNEVMQRGAFTKILIATMGYHEGMGENEHWAMNNVRRAEQLGILDKNEFPESTLDNPITRYEAAKMLARALEVQGETFDNSIYDYTSMIKDYNSIPAKYKEYVLKVFSKGIIVGYPDGTFKGNNKLTRAEGSSMIVRLVDESERRVPEKPVIPERKTKLTQEDIRRLSSYELPKKDIDDAYKDKKTNDDPQGWIDMFYKNGFTFSDKPEEFVFLTDKELVYKDIFAHAGIRGIARVKYTKTNQFNLTPNKYYEADVVFYISRTVQNGQIVTILRKYIILSDWKEVK